MHLLEKRLLQELKKNFPNNSSYRVVIGVSGGADSVALLRGLHSLQNELQIELIVAHFDHQTRAKASRQDAQWVLELSHQLHLRCIVGVPGQQVNPASSPESRPEEVLREQRLHFLIKTAQQEKALTICLAHHADDQAETVLHHIIRGTGIQGLKGIPASRSLTCKPSNNSTRSRQITLQHPLLEIRRSEILDYLQSLNQDFRTDASNQDPQYTRNRIRHELLPILQELNPQVTQHLIQLSRQAQETLEHLQWEIEQLSEQCLISIENDLIRLKASRLQTASPVIMRELFRSLWTRQQWPRKKMTYQHWENLAQFVQNNQTRLDLPAKVTAKKRGDMIVLERKETAG